MTLFAAVRMVGYLNAAAADPTLRERAPFAVQDRDVAHHVVDPQGLVGVDPWQAESLADVFDALVDHPGRPWLLTLPAPGRLAPLQGPPELLRAAVAAEVAVVASGGGWRWCRTGSDPPCSGRCCRPSALTVPTAYEAERSWARPSCARHAS